MLLAGLGNGKSCPVPARGDRSWPCDGTPTLKDVAAGTEACLAHLHCPAHWPRTRHCDLRLPHRLRAAAFEILPEVFLAPHREIAENSFTARTKSGEAGVDVAAWLNRLGLEQYEQAFRENDVDAEVLRDLTAEDLIGLGVTSIGHRRKLLAAIAALRETSPLPSDPITTRAGQEGPSAVKSSSAERRQLTVMFCDLVGSTALSARLDPEDLREVIGVYHRCVAETIGRFDGFVAKYMGDGVLAYFGYPQAHEDDAERAVRAGLAVVEAVRKMPTPKALQVRIGLATGLAVVGDLIGSGAAQEQAVIGETPNLAARLQALAGSDEIVIPENTRRLVGNLFEYESLGNVEVKGLPVPVAAFRVLRESVIGSRFEALRTSETPLIGRDEELEVLRRRWAQAKAGRGQVALISAEPGIGKSRLAEAFRQSLESEPHTRLRYFGPWPERWYSPTNMTALFPSGISWSTVAEA